MLQSIQSSNENVCDYCRRYLLDARVIAGAPHDRKQFCTLACYDHWYADEDSSGARMGHS